MCYLTCDVLLCVQGIEKSTLSEKDAMKAFISRLRKLETFGFAFFTVNVRSDNLECKFAIRNGTRLSVCAVCLCVCVCVCVCVSAGLVIRCN